MLCGCVFIYIFIFIFSHSQHNSLQSLPIVHRCMLHKFTSPLILLNFIYIHKNYDLLMSTQTFIKLRQIMNTDGRSRIEYVSNLLGHPSLVEQPVKGNHDYSR